MSHVVSPATRTRRNVLIVLGALVVLALLVAAVVVLQKKGDDDGDSLGGLHELRKDEFAKALIDAREKAGSWSYVQTTTLNDKIQSVVEGKVTWDGKKVDVAFAPRGATGEAGEARYVDGTWYINDPRLSKSKPWAKLDSTKSKVLVDALDNEVDPRRQLAIFEDPAGFQVIGTENVGVAVAVHYRVTVAIEKVKEVTSNPVVGNPGDMEVFDVWVDNKDRLVKMTTPSDIGAIKSEEIQTFTGYGAPVAIEAPPAAQVQSTVLKARPERKTEVGSN
ncbi:hypothetical protein GCM10011584_27960 [Nocardioides phosphati]|uniref:DUF2092 domain-containing protein n=1 Tax=Nocardioides phosphati TaxID=1867775 RepID=A0ABQ2NC01_9ACTN|nr:hypothetical protein [Nocardioides phosphati]GGO92174.1 hypothetical protein GCM10011584_27960 [Nocardioides phosphati]